MSDLITAIPSTEEYEHCRYSDVGRVLLEVLEKCPSKIYTWLIEVHEYEGSAHLINEGIGFEYWFDASIWDENTKPGWYVVEGITGAYFRGEWGFTDDDEEWYHTGIRPATETEIATQCLDD